MADAKARILLWGIEGSGKSTTLTTIHEKLRPDLRGEILHEPTRLDPTVVSETLLLQLGEVGSLDNQIELVAVPGALDQKMSRKQLLDGVDGLILLLDCSPGRIAANEAILMELRDSLSAYGRSLEGLPIVFQYNKRDVADPFAIEDLHRRIGLSQAAVFETIATTGHGILATLTTISKHVVRSRKGPAAGAPSQETKESPIIESDAEVVATHEVLEAAILSEEDGSLTEELLEELPVASPSGAQPNWETSLEDSGSFGPPPEKKQGETLQIVSVGQAQLLPDQSVEIPLVLGDEKGQTRSMKLSLRLDSLTSDGRD